MFTIAEIPLAERQSWSKCKWQVIETGVERAMTFVTRGQAQKYIDQRNKVAAQEAEKAAKKAAEAAARLAHPIGAAIETQRADTLERVGRDFDAYIARVATLIEKAAGNLDVLAPEPNYRTDGRREYSAKQAKRAAYRAICEVDNKYELGRYVSSTVKLDDAKVAKARSDEQAAASAQYDLFAAKLIGKVGDCASASISGSHVWGYSFLSVVKADGTKEVWKTQQIMNRSVLGTLFNQWPSRLVKGVGA